MFIYKYVCRKEVYGIDEVYKKKSLYTCKKKIIYFGKTCIEFAVQM
jgi:hypothetical protein